MSASFVEIIERSRGQLDKDLLEYLEESNDYMLEIAKWDGRGNPKLIQRGQVLQIRLEAIQRERV